MGRTIGVVGAGPSGLACCKELLAEGFEVTVFDTCNAVGGRWSRDRAGFQTHGVWNELYMNTSRGMSEFSDFPWIAEDYRGQPGVEADYKGQFAHWTETRAYLGAYAEHFGLEAHVQLETKVKQIARGPDDTGWRVTTSRRDGAETTHSFDALVMCVGRYRVERNPLTEPGGSLEHFAGEVLHSSSLESLASMDGKRVLVVGGSVSGADIAATLGAREGAARVAHSMRRVPYVLNKYSPVNHTVVEELLFQRLPVWLGRLLPDALSAKGLKSALLTNFPDQLTAAETGSPEFVRHADPNEAGVTIATGYVEAVRAGKLAIRQEIASVSGHDITFKDGTTETFDVVICGTGFHMDLSLLPDEVSAAVGFVNPCTGQREVALYKHTLTPDYDDLAFAGQHNAIGPHFPSGEMTARYVARIFSGRTARPDDAKLRKGVDKFKQTRGNRHKALDLATQVQEDLADEIGLSPSKLKAFTSPKRLLLGPVFPCYYRTNPDVDDPEVAQRAQQRFEQLLRKPNKVDSA
jgi:cation diffusion facilitator CzcD-associated flavoprotein CzcO